MAGQTEPAELAVLTAVDHARWEADGYLVVRGAVPRAQCAATVDALFGFLGMDSPGC
jgi:hypothetical protein